MTLTLVILFQEILHGLKSDLERFFQLAWIFKIENAQGTDVNREYIRSLAVHVLRRHRGGAPCEHQRDDTNTGRDYGGSHAARHVKTPEAGAQATQ